MLEHRGEYPTVMAAVSKQVGVCKESLRRWLAQADVDVGGRPGLTSSESAEIKRAEAEVSRFREDNEILTAASISSWGPRNH